MSEEGRNREGVIITSKELMYGGVALALTLFFVFAGGYFLGKKRAFEELALQYDDECFADKISQSLSLLGEQSEADEAEGAGTEEEVTQEKQEPQQAQQDGAERELAYAQLCGFGTKQAAELYVARLKRRAIAARIVDRKSLSRKGRPITWYQVVTQSMEKQELNDIISRIKEADKLTDVRIVEMHSDEATTADERA